MTAETSSSGLPADYPIRIKQFRTRLGLTQVELATRLGVSFATVNRWENGQTKPSPLSWSQVLKFEDDGPAAPLGDALDVVGPPIMDFTAAPEGVRVFVREWSTWLVGHRDFEDLLAANLAHAFDAVAAIEVTRARISAM